MSDFTIEQLEALKEGTTPGPWDEDVIYPDCSYIVDDTGGRDAALAFTAPALMDALIAEKRAHQKLRAEIEGFLRICIESAESLELNAMTAYSTEAFESASFVERDTAAALARILEGE